MSAAERGQTPDQVVRVTGYPIGAVAPFGLPTAMPIVVDASVTDQVEVSLGSGVRGTAVILSTDDLLAALGNAPVVSLRKTDTGDPSKRAPIGAVMRFAAHAAPVHGGHPAHGSYSESGGLATRRG